MSIVLPIPFLRYIHKEKQSSASNSLKIQCPKQSISQDIQMIKQWHQWLNEIRLNYNLFLITIYFTDD